MNCVNALLTVNFYFQLPDIQDKMKDENQTILTELISLDTPGKATVQVVIVADPVCITLLNISYSFFD